MVACEQMGWKGEIKCSPIGEHRQGVCNSGNILECCKSSWKTILIVFIILLIILSCVCVCVCVCSVINFIIFQWQLMVRDSRKSRQKNGKKHGWLWWKSQKSLQKHGIKAQPKDHYTVYKIQHLALSTIITCSARFSSVKFCHCGALTNSRKR